MKNKRTLLKFICIFIVSITACVFCIKSSKYKSYVVPGTIVSKDIEQYTNCKNTSTRYIMCIKPNDTNRFKYYSIHVDYSTYCTHNVGNKIAFSVSEKECLRDFKYSIWVEEISCALSILFGILSMCFLAGIVIVIIEPYLNILW